MNRQILIAADSFKDALSAQGVCEAIANGVLRARPGARVRCFPLADGGEGTFEVLREHLGLQTIELNTFDPFQRPIRAAYGLSADGQTAVIEMAGTAGLGLLTFAERDALRTTTYGMGLQIADALKRGAQQIVLAIGGSATNDGGIGMAVALGWQFRDVAGQMLRPIGANLEHIATIMPPSNWSQYNTVSVSVICDVTNPLHGPTGAAHIYARQKGADDAAIDRLDRGLAHFARIAQHIQPLDPDTPGAGAAGGMGFGTMLFLNAQLRRGIDLVLELTHFDEALADTDLIITGEGKIDAQTAYGKLIHGICQKAGRHHIPVIGLCGRLEADRVGLDAIGLKAAYCINPPDATDLSVMLRDTAINLEKTAERLFD
jgi:glycerate 2-kinase